MGCVIPDFPWIMRRLVGLLPGVDPYDLRLYAIVQSSLFSCLILCFLLSTFSKTYWRTFAILSINSFLHLILDALQTKWGNGVHLTAPLSWHLINFGLFWPESMIIYVLMAFVGLFFGVKWINRPRSEAELLFRPVPFFLTLMVYFTMPFLFLSSSEDADNHFVKTLRTVETRKGKYIEIDRAKYMTKNDKNILVTFSGEEIGVEGIRHDHTASVSVKGTFVSNHLIRVSNYHTHNVRFRDTASYLGLLLVAWYWFWSVRNQRHL